MSKQEQEQGQPIAIGERAQAGLRDLLAASERINAQINSYAAGLGAAMDVPEGWQLDIRQMAFVPAPATQPPPAPETEDA